MNGLADAMTQATDPRAVGQAPQQASPMRDLNQIVAMIKQGVSPDELVQGGVPAELVQAAIEQIQKEATQVPPEQAGLANSLMARGQ